MENNHPRVIKGMPGREVYASLNWPEGEQPESESNVVYIAVRYNDLAGGGVGTTLDLSEAKNLRDHLSLLISKIEDTEVETEGPYQGPTVEDTVNLEPVPFPAEQVATAIDDLYEALVAKEWGASPALEVVKAVATSGGFTRG